MDEYYRAVRALPAWLARPLSALPPDTAEQVHEIRLRVGCGVQLTIGGKPCCPAELPALQKLRLTPLQMEEIFVTLCGGSVHSHETEIAAGYVTLSCGCRAGLAGQFYCAPGQSAVLQELRSVNIRVARNREFPLPQKLRDILQQRFIGMLLMGNPTAAKRPFCEVSPGNLQSRIGPWPSSTSGERYSPRRKARRFRSTSSAAYPRDRRCRWLCAPSRRRSSYWTSWAGWTSFTRWSRDFSAGWNLSPHFTLPAGKKLPAVRRCSICKSAVRSMWQCF